MAKIVTGYINPNRFSQYIRQEDDDLTINERGRLSHYDFTSQEVIRRSIEIGLTEKLKKFGFPKLIGTPENYIASLERSSTIQQFYHLMTTRDDLHAAPLILSHSIPSYGLTVQGFQQQHSYASPRSFDMMMHRAIEDAYYYVKEERWGFQELMYFFSYRRFLHATESQHPEAQYYGHPSTIQWKTICEGVYADISHRIPKEDIYICDRLVGQVKIEAGKPVFYHSDPVNMEKLMCYARSAYDICIFVSKETVVQQLGLFFYFFCLGKFEIKGEVSIAEMFMRTILKLKGCEDIGPWRSGVIPWVEVICAKEAEDFATIFPTLFES